MPKSKNYDCIDNYNVRYKEIPGCDFVYYVTEDGRVWSTTRKNGIERFMKLQTQDGYKSVGLTIGGKRVSKRVHRLVADAFIENPEKKPYINHKDGDRSNNHFENLEWCTQKENVNHAISVLGKWANSEKQKMAASKQGKSLRKLDFETAKKIREEYKLGCTSGNKLSKKYGLSKPCILKIIHNKSYKEP